MHDFESKKRQVLERVDIVDVVSEHVTLKQRGRRWVGLCPFHSEKTPSFTVNPDLGLFKCFGCGKGGDIFSFVQARENVQFMEAMKILADRVGVDLSDTARGPSAGGPSRTDLAKVNDWATRFFRQNLLDGSIGQSTREYLDTRGISKGTAERFNIGLATTDGGELRNAAARAGFGEVLLLAADLLRSDETGRTYETFRNRLMFPISDSTRRVVGFGGRTLADDRAKYLNTRQNALFDKGRGLYGIDLARDAISSRHRAILVEGYTDCIAAHQAGFTETVATLGTALTEAQVNLLRRYCEELILLFDSDAAGEAAADRAIHVALPRCIAVRLARIPEGKDPSEFLNNAGAERFSDVLNGAVDALEFKWCQTRARFDGGASDTGRREAILDFLRVVAESFNSGAVDEIQRGLLANQVAHVLRIDSREVLRALARLGDKPRGWGAETHNLRQRTPDVPRGQKQAVWRHILEVLLNEPGLLGVVGSPGDPSAIMDERDRRIAGLVLALADELGEFHLADVLARCVDPADAERVTELASRGEELGNYEVRLRSAIERLKSASSDTAVDMARHTASGLSSDGGTSDRLAVCHDGAKGHRHFAPRRLIRRTISDPEILPEESVVPNVSREQP